MAKNAQRTPIIMKKNAIRIENLVVPSRVPNKKALPKNIRRSPMIKAIGVVILRAVIWSKVYSIALLAVAFQWKNPMLGWKCAA